jgi:glycosyltransferase involved in cell wall biosynthesis
MEHACVKIAFDSWSLGSRFRYHGTYVYAQSLIAEFKKIAGSRSDVKFCLFTAPSNSNDAALIEPSAGFALQETAWLGHDRLWRLGGINVAAARAGANVIFSPSCVTLAVGAVPVVCTIHDVTPITMPSHSRTMTLKQRLWLRFSTRRALAIITVSECSRNDLIRIYGIPESRVFVIYNGYDKTVFNDVAPDPAEQKNLFSRLGLHRPYILHHGVIQPRKNLKRLIQAYRLLLTRNHNLEIDLVLAGSWGWVYKEILATANDPKVTVGRVVFPGTLSNGDLAMLVKGAELVVMPSLYEGFCLPMVEAMACGVPVVASNGSCLPEVSGGVLRYFDPYSIDDMAVCIEQALEEQELRKRLVEEGKKRAAFFEWRRCAEQTLTVLTQNSSR